MSHEGERHGPREVSVRDRVRAVCVEQRPSARAHQAAQRPSRAGRPLSREGQLVRLDTPPRTKERRERRPFGDNDANPVTTLRQPLDEQPRLTLTAAQRPAGVDVKGSRSVAHRAIAMRASSSSARSTRSGASSFMQR